MFNNEATISGNPGTVTMSVCDKDGKFSRDTQRISLKPGELVLFVEFNCVLCIEEVCSGDQRETMISILLRILLQISFYVV